MSATPLRSATVGGLLAVLIWSLSASALAFVGTVNPFLLIAVSYSAGYLMFIMKWIAQKKNPVRVMLQMPAVSYLAPLAGIFVHDLTWVFAIQQAPQEEATLIIYQWPILIVLFTAIMHRKMPALSTIIGSAMGFIGVCLLVLGKYDSLNAIQLQPGHFYALICALSWSLYSASRSKVKDSNSDSIAGNYLIGACISFLIWYYAYDADFKGVSIETLVTFAIFSLVLKSCYLLWDFAMKKGDQQFVAVFSFLIPALAVGFLCLFGFSALTPSLIVSICLILTGITLAKFNFKWLAQKLRPQMQQA